MSCDRCGGVWHPSSGALYSVGSGPMRICGPCERKFWHWAKGHTNLAKRVGSRNEKPARFVYFYEHTKLR